MGVISAGLPTTAFAQYFEGARLLAFAEAQRALSTGNDSIYVNPAGLALGRVYAVEVGYLDDIRGSDRRFNGSIIDSQAGPIAGGLAYTYSERRPEDIPSGDQRLEGHRGEISLATLVAQTAAIGLTARYMTFNHMNGETEVEEGSFNAFTLDAGVQWRITDSIAVGLVGYNLTNSDRKELPISWGAGIGFQLPELSIEADIRYNAQIGKARYAGGASYVIGGFLPIRAGVSYDLANDALAVSMGIGYFVERLGIDVGYRQRVDGNYEEDDGDDRIFAVSLRAVFL